MTKSKKSRSSRFRFQGLESACWLLGLALVYIASFGPAHSLAIKGKINPRFVCSFYVLLPKCVAWRSLQIWHCIDKGAYIEGLWFGPSKTIWRGL